MESGTNRYVISCYIGRTKFMAGIFLSRKIAEAKPYASALELTEYATYEEAEQMFFNEYGSWINKKEFYVNKLYDVRKRNIYAAVCIPEGAGVFEMENFTVLYEAATGRRFNICSDWMLDELTYEEAVRRVKKYLSKSVGKFRVEIYGQPKVNVLITWEEAVRRRNMTGIYEK